MQCTCTYTIVYNTHTAKLTIVGLFTTVFLTNLMTRTLFPWRPRCSWLGVVGWSLSEEESDWSGLRGVAGGSKPLPPFVGSIQRLYPSPDQHCEGGRGGKGERRGEGKYNTAIVHRHSNTPIHMDNVYMYVSVAVSDVWVTVYSRREVKVWR